MVGTLFCVLVGSFYSFLLYSTLSDTYVCIFLLAKPDSFGYEGHCHEVLSQLMKGTIRSLP